MQVTVIVDPSKKSVSAPGLFAVDAVSVYVDGEEVKTPLRGIILLFLDAVSVKLYKDEDKGWEVSIFTMRGRT